MEPRGTQLIVRSVLLRVHVVRGVCVFLAKQTRMFWFVLTNIKLLCGVWGLGLGLGLVIQLLFSGCFITNHGLPLHVTELFPFSLFVLLVCVQGERLLGVIKLLLCPCFLYFSNSVLVI